MQINQNPFVYSLVHSYFISINVYFYCTVYLGLDHLTYFSSYTTLHILFCMTLRVRFSYLQNLSHDLSLYINPVQARTSKLVELVFERLEARLVGGREPRGARVVPLGAGRVQRRVHRLVARLVARRFALVRFRYLRDRYLGPGFAVYKLGCC